MTGVHFHLIINHLPVVGAFFALLALLWAAWRKDESSSMFAMICLLIVGISAAPAYFSGEPAEEAVEHLATVSHDFIEKHEDAAWKAFLAAGVCGAIGAAGLIFRRARTQKWYLATGLTCITVTYGLMAWTANLGGNVRHTEIRPDAVASQARDRSANEDD